MKQYQPLRIQPNTHQFYNFVKDRLSPAGTESAAYAAVLHLFQLAEGFYKTLDFHTSEQLAAFVDAGKYLTPAQEHDLIAITAHYIQGIETTTIRKIVEMEQLSDGDRAVLYSALELFKSTADTSRAAVGRPRWVD
jgi:hypothetical protein